MRGFSPPPTLEDQQQVDRGDHAMEVFKNDFRCITMDQRNANGGEATGPVPVDNPWDAFADDQLGLMDHLGIREFFFMGYCIGGCFAGKLLQRAPIASSPLSFAKPSAIGRKTRQSCIDTARITGNPTS